MTDPLTTLTAAAIAKLAFEKFIEASVGALRKKFSEEAIVKMDNLSTKIIERLRGKSAKLDATLVKVEHGERSALELITKYLDVAMEEYPDFSEEIRKLSQEILTGSLQISSNSPMVQSNYGNAIGWQTKVEGGTAYIGADYHLYSLHSAESAPPKNIPPQNLPPSGAIEFVGREHELQSLHEQLQKTDRIAITAVQGMAGVGKSELALQYARTHSQQHTYPGGICWIKARDADVGSQIVSFAITQLGLFPPDDLELIAQVMWCWRHWREGNTLIVLDNVTDYGKIQPFLPPFDSRFKILITTRLRLGYPINQFSLDVLAATEAISLLETLIGKARINKEMEEAISLAQWLGYLPLGLELVGHYLVRKPDLSLVSMRKRLEAKALRSQALKPEASTTARQGISAAIEISWQELDEQSQNLGCLLSLFALAPIPWQLVEICFPDCDSEELEDLRDSSLLRLHLLNRVENGTYQLHLLIREFFRAKLEQSNQADDLKYNFCRAMVDAAQQVPISPHATRVSTEVFSLAVPHISEAATTLIAWVDNEDVLWLFSALGNFYTQQGSYTQAENWYQLCLSTTRSRLGDEHPVVATSLNNLAYLYELQGGYSEAEPLYEKSLEINRTLLGEKHPSVASSLNNLAHLYEAQGRYSEAETLYLQALTLKKELLGEDHPDVASSLNYLAHLFTSQGRYSEAEPLYVQALALSQHLLSEEHPFVASSLSNLAGLYTSQGRYAEAEPLYIKSLQIREKQLGSDHPDVANSLNNLALLYASQGRYAEAEPLYIRSLQIKEQQLGSDHPDVATSLNNLAGLYQDQGRYAEAELLYIRSLQIKEQQLGENHPTIAASLNNLAALYSSMKNYAAAEPLYMRSLEIRKRMLGDKHPDVANTLSNLARLYMSEGRYTEAEPLYLHALEVMEMVLGSDHPSVATNLNNLAELYTLQRNYNDAELLYLRALEIAIHNLGKDHPYTETIWRNFIRFLSKAIDENQSTVLSDHPLSQGIINQLLEGADR